MGKLKGQVEYEVFKSGGKLSRSKAIKAHCYECNGLEQSAVDCQGKSCPLYQYQPYKNKKGLTD